MSDQQTTDRPLRVCMLGSSYVGAVFKAWQDTPPPSDLAFSFFAAGGSNYQSLGIENGEIVNALAASGDPRISEHDCFVVYGDSPDPYEYVKFEGNLAHHPFSAQARAIALRDWVMACRSMALVHDLRALIDRPILVVARNFHMAEAFVGSVAERAHGTAELARVLAPNVYVPPPPELFTEDRRPDRQYYRGSISLSGKREGDDRVNHHFNAAGGALVLAAVMNQVRLLPQTGAGRQAQAALPPAPG